MTLVRWTTQASNQFDAIYEFVAKDNPTAALAQVQAIVRSIHATSEFPESGRIGRVLSTREIVVPRTPYIVAYRVKTGGIEILAIHHGAQQWPDRF